MLKSKNLHNAVLAPLIIALPREHDRQAALSSNFSTKFDPKS